MRAESMRRTNWMGLALIGIAMFGIAARAQQRYADVIGSGDHDTAIPTPASVLGYEVGDWHVRHDQLLAYMSALAESSPRVRLDEIGRTHEGRALVQLIITAPANLLRLESLRQRHLDVSRPHAAVRDPGAAPLVVQLGYSVHGNEASGSNAALVVAWHLASSLDPEIEALLADTVVILDPCLNPDGLDRFAIWANMHRGVVPVGDPNHREHNEGWPNGRTNHYWFDLNRDWLLLRHPESRARLKQFRRWRPNVVTDHHEMSPRSTFFFQPGVPTRTNPLTPRRNVELTRAIANAHARALDRRGVLYFTEERYDDYYFGKGSTYPDLQGAIGILFEQASVRGHVQENDSGLLTFPFAIANQIATSMSSLRAAHDRREALLRYQREFFESAHWEAAADPVKGWVFGDSEGVERTRRAVELLMMHGIAVHRLATPLDRGETRFDPRTSFVVPAGQDQYRLARSLFERRVEFEDESFYDVSAWTLPLAFDLPFAELRAGDGEDYLGVRLRRIPAARAGGVTGAAEEPYAWIIPWDSYLAPRALYRLLDAGLRIRVATGPFTAQASGRAVRFRAGAIVVPKGIQPRTITDVGDRVAAAARRSGVVATAVVTGLTPEGSDLGSAGFRTLRRPRVALIVGDGVSTYQAGEAWFVLDHEFEIPVSMLEARHLGGTRLGRYTHLVLVDGVYRDVPSETVASLSRWVREGGVLVTQDRGAVWTQEHLLPVPERERPRTEPRPSGESESTPLAKGTYAEREAQRARRRIPGTIFACTLDPTHPIAFGFTRKRIAVMKHTTVRLRPSRAPYANVVRFAPDPLLAGYCARERLDELASTPAVTCERIGAGAIVRMAINPNHRGYWLGTARLFANALFFSRFVDR